MPFFRMFRRELNLVAEPGLEYEGKEDERISLLVNLTQQAFLASNGDVLESIRYPRESA